MTPECLTPPDLSWSGKKNGKQKLKNYSPTNYLQITMLMICLIHRNVSLYISSFLIKQCKIGNADNNDDDDDDGDNDIYLTTKDIPATLVKTKNPVRRSVGQSVGQSVHYGWSNSPIQTHGWWATDAI